MLIVGRTCNTPASFLQVTASVVAGHSYTLTLLNHDDNFANPPDPSFTIVDDVTVS